jgi:hypothetical protein
MVSEVSGWVKWHHKGGALVKEGHDFALKATFHFLVDVSILQREKV